MRAKLLSIDQILALLTGTPPHITALATGLAPDQLRSSPDFGGWSANEVLAHLRACGDVWGGNIVTILNQDKPTLRGINPRAWIKKTDYPEQEFHHSLQAFTTQRAELLAVLKALPPEAWLRTAIGIDMIGQRFERNVLHYADGLARHERSHLKQIERIVNTMRRS
jgi:hypothetical protein